MTFQKLNPTTIALKSGQGMLTAGNDGTLKIGDHVIEGPGEYDIAGIGLHVFGDHAYVVAEAIQTCIVWKSEAKLTNGDDASIDIIVALIDSTDAITNLVKTNDPRVIVFGDETIANTVATHDGITVDAVSSYKITQPSLPAESRVAVLLT